MSGGAAVEVLVKLERDDVVAFHQFMAATSFLASR